MRNKRRSFGNSGFEISPKRTRKREFLDEMERVIPWLPLVTLVAQYTPKGETGRPPFEPEVMLRGYLLQQFFGLSDPAMEEALHDVAIYRGFAHLDSGMSKMPDESTILRFRHLIERHGVAAKILDTVNAELVSRGLLLRTGTVVDATLISAPSSTKNNWVSAIRR
jgi:IS5 family transposase